MAGGHDLCTATIAPQCTHSNASDEVPQKPLVVASHDDEKDLIHSHTDKTESVACSASPSEQAATTQVENNDASVQNPPDVTSYKEDLKYNKHAASYYAPKRRVDTEQKQKSRVLSFDEVVKVVPIPMRTEYSLNIKSRLWSNAMEIQQNAARNSVEFAWEGWNWRTVLEDESMLVCMNTSELIHPCHYHRHLNSMMLR